MPIQGEYMGMMLTIEDLDGENREFFRYCAAGEFRLQRGRQSGLLRYPPTTACPWTGDRESEWVAVDGRGTVHAYGEVHHAIQPAFKDKVPYLILLVDLDTQKGQPSAHEALRVGGNLVMPDGCFAPPRTDSPGGHRFQSAHGPGERHRGHGPAAVDARRRRGTA